jgi:hypothetical protein
MSTSSNFTLEEMGMTDDVAKIEIDCRNLMYSGSRLRCAGALTAEAKMMIVVVVVDDRCRAV